MRDYRAGVIDRSLYTGLVAYVIKYGKLQRAATLQRCHGEGVRETTRYRTQRHERYSLVTSTGSLPLGEPVFLFLFLNKNGMERVLNLPHLTGISFTRT